MSSPNLTMIATAQSLLSEGKPAEAKVILEFFAKAIDLVEAAKTASNYIHSVGANQTEKGLPHPQALLLEALDTAIHNLDPQDPRFKPK